MSPRHSSRWNTAAASLTAGIALTLCAAILPIPPATAQGGAPPTPSAAEQEADRAFKAGNALLEKKQYAEALAEYRKALRVYPDETALLWNGGMAAFFSKDYKTAEDFWKRHLKEDSRAGRVHAKLIQTYQATGDAKARDAVRSDLIALRKSGNVPELVVQEKFCREIFTHKGQEVYVYEHYELKGDRALRYAFLFLKPDGTTDFRVSLGSYALTNRLLRETGELKPGERLFHLDRYDRDNSHETYGFFSSAPSYEETRTLVLEAVDGKRKPVSSTSSDGKVKTGPL